MRWILLGAVLALLLLFPSFGAAVLSMVGAVLAEPVAVAFGLGLAAGLRSPWLRRWAR